MDHYLAVDIGTTAIKVVLYDSDLNVEDSERHYYLKTEMIRNRSEQDPDLLITDITNCIRKITDRNMNQKSTIKSISLSCAMHSVILLDEAFQRLTPAILWNDARAYAQVEKFKETHYKVDFYMKSGTPIHPMSPFAKILWFNDHYGNQYLENVYIADIKSYIMKQLTNDFIVDLSIASASGLLNIHNLRWDADILNYCGVRVESLPKLVDVDHCEKISNIKFLEMSGLNDICQIHIGASDGCLSSFAFQGNHDNSLVVTAGTSGAARILSSEIVLNPVKQTFCYYLNKDTWVLGAPVNNAGNILDWASKTFAHDKTIDDTLRQIGETNAGSNGLIFKPYIYGERFPYWDSSIRGSYHNISSECTSSDFIRSAIEGTLINLEIAIETLTQKEQHLETIILTGGFFESEIIIDIATSIFSKDIQVIHNFESGCFGAVKLLFPQKMINHVFQKRIPSKKQVDDYRKIKNRWVMY